MQLSPAGGNMVLDAVAALIDGMSLHSDNPGTTGANEWSGDGYTRQAITYGPADNMVADITEPVVFSGPALLPAPWAGLWSGSTYIGAIERSAGDATSNSAGEMTVESAPLTLAGGS